MNSKDEKYKSLLDRAANGMALDYHRGGILWEEKVLLEFPLHYSPPEIILNGWIDGLLNYGDLQHSEHEIVYIRSLKEMSELLRQFDDEKHKLSLYSNASPVRSILRRSDKKQQFNVKFISRNSGYPNYFIELGELAPVLVAGKERRSPYETQIYNDNGSSVTVALSCNQMYDTYIQSNAPFSLSFRRGIYNEKRATPPLSDEPITLVSVSSPNGVQAVHLDQARNRMFCGYPTNFAKEGDENFYHQYHIVGLLYLSLDRRIGEDVRKKLREFAWKWMKYTDEHTALGRNFTAYQRVLDVINSHKFNIVVKTWPELLAKTGQS